MHDAASSADQAAIPQKPSLSSPSAKRISPKRYFTKSLKPGQDVYDLVEWEHRDVEIKKGDEVIFSQKDVEVPKAWSHNAATIVASKYFRGHDSDGDRETSVKQLIDRVVKTIARAGIEHRYYGEAEAEIVEEELRFLCLNQMMAFNSPVWFNVGTNKDPQCSACFILDIQDDMDSILNWIKEEGKVFKRGSGAGANISHMREENAQLSGGGHASGPLSFALTADRSAGAIKSGGGTRRAAKMLVMDVDHPDVEEFVETKVEGEKIAQALIAQGFSADFTDPKGAYALAPWQNANNSVRVTDEFMTAVEEGKSFALNSRIGDGGVSKMVNATDLWRKIAEAAHYCGDPGLQFHDTVNRMHTCLADGEIEASNPCSEYMFLNNTACNLASLNLLKFRKADGSFDVESFMAAAAVTVLAMEIIVAMSSYPTETITVEAKKYRTLGIGFTNLGALLMASGIAYDSDEGRDYAAAIMSLLSGVGYATSGEMAEKVGTFSGYFANQEHVVNVMKQHRDAHNDLMGRIEQNPLLKALGYAAEAAWDQTVEYAENTGLRNAQISVLAPTGTISFMMDCDTTGVEPDLALVKYKKLVGGGTIKIVNQTVGPALKKLGYTDEQMAEILLYIEQNDTIEGAPHLRAGHLSVFDCSITPAKGDRSISWKGHVDMMAATQPFISGAISKTVNMPREATVEDVMDVYMDAWKKGLKAIAIYRDGSKESQPLNLNDKADDQVVEKVVFKPQRERLPDTRHGAVHKFSIAGHDGYVVLGYYPDGRLGEVFVNVSKQGSTLGGLLDAWATMISMGLQYGMPLDTVVEKFKHTSFEPSGFTGNPEIRSASSILDYIVRLMEMNAVVATEGGLQTVPVKEEDKTDKTVVKASPSPVSEGPPCTTCGAMTQRAGSCYSCTACGSSTGCG